MVCTYDSCWWIGMVCKIFKEEGDVSIKFMAPHGPSPYFYWQRDDFCYVLTEHILCVISPPIPATISGHNYQIEKQDLHKIIHTSELG